MPSIYSRGPVLEVCQTQTCLSAAASIQNYVDFNTNPCDDFYQFACGNYVDHAVLDETELSRGAFTVLDVHVLDGIASILNGTYEDLLGVNIAPDFVEGDNYSSEDDQKVFGLLKAYFSSCMDTESIDREGLTHIYPVLGNIEVAASNDMDIVAAHTAIMAYTDSIRAPALFDTSVRPDVTAPEKNTLVVGRIKYDYLTGTNLSDPAVADFYKSMLINVANDLFSPNDTDRMQAAQQASFKLWERDQVEARVDNVITFQRAIIALSEIPNDNLINGVGKNKKSIVELQESYPFMDWETYFRYFVPSDRDVPDELTDETPTGYLEGLNTLLTSTSSQTFGDYVMLNMLQKYSASLDSQSASLLLYNEANRAATCATFVRTYFDIPMVRYYAMRYIGGAERRNQVYEFVSHIHETWSKRLERLDWLDDTTRANAKTKIDNMGQWVAYNLNYPDDRSPSELSEYLGPIEFGESFIVNHLRANRFAAVTHKYMDIGKPVNRENFNVDSEINLLLLNAFHNPLGNNIAILPGIIQDPAYVFGQPAYLNYGGLGSTIGHEFTHGFDAAGRNFDGDGRQINWWTNETSAIFEEKTQCLINQYGKMTVEAPNNETLHVDGKLTLSENVADNGGINAAYEAFAEYWSSGAEKQMTLPGIDLTPEQLFFVSFARFFCIKSTLEYNAHMITEDEHSPNPARIRGTLQNSVDFAKAYDCPVGSYMNPKEKCSIW